MTNLKYLHLAQHLFLMLDFWTFDLNLRKTPIRVQELLLSLSGDVSSDEERQKSSSSSSSTKILGGKRRTLFEEVDVWHRRSPPSEGLDLPLGPPPSHLLRGSRVLWPPGAHLQADPGPSAPESRAWVPGSGAARESFWISLCCVPDVLVPKQNRRRIFGPVGRRRRSLSAWGAGSADWKAEKRAGTCTRPACSGTEVRRFMQITFTRAHMHACDARARSHLITGKFGVKLISGDSTLHHEQEMMMGLLILRGGTRLPPGGAVPFCVSFSEGYFTTKMSKKRFNVLLVLFFLIQFKTK